MSKKTRLLFIVHSLCIGGTERLVTQISSSLDPDEYTIGICCLDARGQLWDECEKRGYELFEIQRRPGWHLSTFLKIAEVFRLFSPTVIHAHQYTPYVYAVAGKLLSLSPARIIFTEHGRHFPDVVSRKRQIANVVLQHFASRVTAVCDFSRRALQANEKFCAKPISVVYNGLHDVPEETEATRSLHQELSLSAETPLIGFVGTLRDVKNPAYLLEMFAYLAPLQPDAHLVFIGDGPLRAELEAQACASDNSNRVHFVGARNPATPYLASLSVFVLPSRCEAASLALLEAMAHGIPAVVTDTGGNPELVNDGVDGMLAPLDDAQQFAEIVSHLLERPAVRESLSRSAQSRVKEQFDFGTMLRSYREMYEELS